MKRLILASFLAVATSFASAQAAPPTQQQVEKLLDAMEAQKVVDQMIPAMMQQAGGMVDQMLATESATTADRERAQGLMKSQEQHLREMLAWNNLKPIYIKVYTDTLSDKEVLAMTRFYQSPEGRSVMQKLPQIMQRSMVEMQPLLESSIQKMTQDIQKEFDSGKPAKK